MSWIADIQELSFSFRARLNEKFEVLQAIDRQSEPLTPTQCQGLEWIALDEESPEIRKLAQSILRNHSKTEHPELGPRRVVGSDGSLGPDPWFKRANCLRQIGNDVALRMSPNSEKRPDDFQNEIQICIWASSHDTDALVRFLAKDVLGMILEQNGAGLRRT